MSKLISVQELTGNRSIGVIDTESGKVIVPLEYSSVTFQKYGIVANQSDGKSDIFQFDGTAIIPDVVNPLLLADNFIIVSNSYGKCYILKSKDGKARLLDRTGYDSVYFFCGKKSEPIMYTSKINLKPMLSDPDYLANGAGFTDLICATRGNYWGVINRDTYKIEVNFDATSIIQTRNTRLVVNLSDGHVKLL